MSYFIKLGNPTPGTPYGVTTRWGYESAEKTRGDLDLLVKGTPTRNCFVGGSENFGIRGASTVDVFGAIPFTIDNTSYQWQGSTGITINVVVWLRLASASGTVTPVIYDLTNSGTASYSGDAACSATATDYSGSNQKQTLVLDLPTGVTQFVLQITPSLTTTVAYAKGWLDLYI